MPKLAANITLLFREVPLLERIAAAAAAGFTAVECLWPYEITPEVMRRALDDHGLAMALINTPVGDAADPHVGLAACAGREGDFRAGIQQALAYALAVGAGRIHLMAGEWTRTSENKTAIIANLREAGRRAQDVGVTLCIEPINPRDRPNWFLQSTAQALAVIEDVASPAVKLLFDAYHVQIIEGDLTRRLEACIDSVGHVQIAGVPDRREPDDGEINIHHLLATLDRLGYAGYIGCEYNPRGVTRDGLGWAALYGVRPV